MPRALPRNLGEQEERSIKQYMRERGVHGLPPVGGALLARGERVREQRGGKPLSRTQANKLQISRVQGRRVNPTAAQIRYGKGEALQGADEDAPRVGKFGLPKSWKLKTTVRNIPTVDNLYYGPCGTRQNKPRLRSLTEVYKCYYTNDLAKQKYCKGNLEEAPCPAMKGARAVERQPLSKRGLPLKFGKDYDFLEKYAKQLEEGTLDPARVSQKTRDKLATLRDSLDLVPPQVRRATEDLIDQIDIFLNAAQNIGEYEFDIGEGPMALPGFYEAAAELEQRPRSKSRSRSGSVGRAQSPQLMPGFFEAAAELEGKQSRPKSRSRSGSAGRAASPKARSKSPQREPTYLEFLEQFSKARSPSPRRPRSKSREPAGEFDFPFELPFEF